MADRSWHFKRIRVISDQGGKCFNWDKTGCLAGARDVIAEDGQWHAYCGRCRLKLDASKRIPKSLRTKKELKAQVTIDQYLKANG
jgi:hypothetical protein